jgi:hypothetical protein
MESPGGVKGLVFRQPAEVDTAEDLLINFWQTGDGAEESRSAKALSPPVQAEIPDYGPQPGRKAGTSPWFESTNPLQITAFELLADKDEAVADVISVSFEQVNNLENQRGKLAQELIPRLFRVPCRQGE